MRTIVLITLDDMASADAQADDAHLPDLRHKPSHSSSDRPDPFRILVRTQLMAAAR
jgi:hypothetical protein